MVLRTDYPEKDSRLDEEYAFERPAANVPRHPPRTQQAGHWRARQASSPKSPNPKAFREP